MCQPGRPAAPRRRPRRCPRPACAPSRARSRAGPPCGRRPRRPRPGPSGRRRGARARRRRRQRAHAEVDVAAGLVGVAARRPARAISVDDRLDRLGGQRLVVGPAEAEPVGVGEVVRRSSRAPARPTARPARARGVVDLVVDVGDVGHERRLVALVLEEALEQREDDERAGVADVDAARRPSARRRRCPTFPGSRGSQRPHAGRCACRGGEIVRTEREATFGVRVPTGRSRVASRRRVGRSRRRSQEAFRTLPERYLGAEPGFDATYHIRLGDIGHTWEVRCTTHGARVRDGRDRPRRPTS